MRKFKKGLTLSVMSAMLVLSACGGGSSEPASGGSSSNPAPATDTPKPAADAKKVTIGYTGPLSGGAAFYGKNALSGLEMATKEINEGGGFEVAGEKYQIDLQALDDKYMPNEAGINAKRLVQENNAPIVFTPHSGGVFALQEFNETDGFLLGAYTSEPQVTERGNTLTVRIPPSYAGYIEPFSKYSMERFGKKVALVPGNHAYAKAWTELFKPQWEALGGEVVAENPMDYNKDTDFYAGVSKSLAENPDVLFVGGASEPTALVIKQARELGFKGGFIVMDQAKMDEMATVLGSYELLEGVIGVIPLTEYGGDAAPKFIEKYQEQYDKIPGSEAAYHYQSLYVFVEAMKLAGTVEDAKAIHAKIGEALGSAPKENMVYNVPAIDDKGGFASELRIAAVEEQKVKVLEVK